MKKNYFSVIALGVISLIALSCEDRLTEFEPKTENQLREIREKSWQKIANSITENFRSVVNIESENKLMLLTDDSLNYYVCEKNFIRWEKKQFPVKVYNATPVVFKGCIYLNTPDGIYRYNRDWKKITNWRALQLAVNEKTLFAVKYGGYFKSDTILEYDGVSFKQNAELLKATESFNNKKSTRVAFCNNLRVTGENILADYIHASPKWQAHNIYTSQDGGKTWESDCQYSGSLNVLTDIFLHEGELGKVSEGHNGFYARMFFIYSPSYKLSSFGEYYCSLSTPDDFYYSAKINEVENYNQIIDCHYGIFSPEKEFRTEQPIKDFEFVNGTLIAVGDAGAIYVFN